MGGVQPSEREGGRGERRFYAFEFFRFRGLETIDRCINGIYIST